MAVGGESRLFVQKSYYSVIFPNAEGLRVGSPVKMAGVQVGTVTDVSLSTDPEKSGIQVEVGLLAAVERRLGLLALLAIQVQHLERALNGIDLVAGNDRVGLAQGAHDAERRVDELRLHDAQAAKHRLPEDKARAVAYRGPQPQT